MKKITPIFILTLLFLTSLHAKLTTYDFPDEVRKSQFYEVSVKQGENIEKSFVHVTECPDGPFTDHKIWITVQDRSMSFTHFAFDEGPVEVTVTKTFGTRADNAIITPSSYGVQWKRFDGRSVTFELEKPEYVSVRFVSDDNTDEFNNIKNGLMIFADEPENDVPDPKGKGVVVYQKGIDPIKLVEAQTIYFPPGLHRLKGTLTNGILQLRDDQAVYLHPEAYIYGIFLAAATHNVKLYGRGVISGGEHDFHYDGMRQQVEFDRLNYRINTRRGSHHTVEGLTIIESINHTLVVPDNSLVKDVKFISWACNNDGLRSGDGSVVDHVFMKVCDDYFYATTKTLITNSVLWPMFNGATLQLGWGTRGGGGCRFINNHIINPEWEWIGSNTGFIASQCKPGANISDIVIENVVFDGDINALASLDYALVAGREYHYDGSIRDITFRNIELKGRQVWYPERGWDDYERVEVQLSRNYNINEKHPAIGGRSVIRGIKNEAGDIAWVENITFENVKINGQWVTEDNHAKYFDVDPETTRNIRFLINPELLFQDAVSRADSLRNPQAGAVATREDVSISRAASWFGEGPIAKWTINLPKTGKYELRYALVPVYSKAEVKVEIENTFTQAIPLEPTEGNAFGNIKKTIPELFELKKGKNHIELSIGKGLVYPDLIELVSQELTPGTPSHFAYTHWHGIIRRGESNWISNDLYFEVSPDELEIRLSGNRWDIGVEEADSSQSVEVSIVDLSGKTMIPYQPLFPDGRVDLSSLTPNPYMTVITDHQTFWIAKHFNYHALDN